MITREINFNLNTPKLDKCSVFLGLNRQKRYSAGNNNAMTFVPSFINVTLCLLIGAGVQNNVSGMETRA